VSDELQRDKGNKMTTATANAVMRPLLVLVPLIKQDLKDGDEASERAGMPYYKAAGEKMIEAKPQCNGDFQKWVKRNFSISPSQARRYMSYAHTTIGKQNNRAREFESLREMERHTGSDARPTGGYVRREWQPAVDDTVERARREAERLRAEDLTRREEREAQRVLALRLIDIGYKVLVKELHPDKGGDRGAMQRLGIVRDRLKASV
jgi:hypothetical protein